MNIVGSSIYFDDNFKIELCYKKLKKEISLLTANEVENFIVEEHINDNELLEKIRIKYTPDGTGSFSKLLKETITYNFNYEDVEYVIYDGDIYYYNDDFYKEIKDALKQIVFRTYNSDDDKSLTWYNDYLRKNNYADIKSKLEEKKERK